MDMEILADSLQDFVDRLRGDWEDPGRDCEAPDGPLRYNGASVGDLVYAFDEYDFLEEYVVVAVSEDGLRIIKANESDYGGMVVFWARIDRHSRSKRGALALFLQREKRAHCCLSLASSAGDLEEQDIDSRVLELRRNFKSET